MKNILYLFLLFILTSCSSIDVEKSLVEKGLGRQEIISSPLIVIPKPEIIYVDVPVFIPEAETAPRKTTPGEQSVKASNVSGIIKPQDYSHAAMVYDYNPDLVYEAYAQPLRVTDICLQPGERAVETPFISDSERWIIGAGVSYDNGLAIQHVYVKPVSSSLSASLIINTDRRVYRIILRSYSDYHMPIVRWRYLSGLPTNYPGSPASNAESEPLSIDPRFVSYNYKINYGGFKMPKWTPELVFDDGAKTYITFPLQVLQMEYPALFENRRDILNYRIIGNLAVIDKLIENITVRIGRTEITITKKKG